MSNWKLIVPEGGQNLIDNPSFETGTTGWATGGTNTIAQSADEQRFGVYSLKCSYSNNTTLASYTITITDTQHTFSCRVFIPTAWDGGAINLDIANFASATIDTASDSVTATGEWLELEIVFTPDGGDLTGDLIVETASAPTSGVDIYIDGAQCEAKGYSTTYIDGDQDDCEWDGAEHASTSTRLAYGIGGRVRDFEDDLDFATMEMQDVGMPPVSLDFNSQLNQDTLASLRYERRAMRFTSVIIGTSLSNMHSTRQTLIKAFLPNTGKVNDPPRLRRLRYTGADDDKEIDVAYDTGFELGNKEGFTDEAQVRFIAPDPMFYQIGESGGSLNTSATETVRAIIARLDGAWDNLGPPDVSGTYNSVEAVAVDSDNGYIYIGGDFLNFDNIANADGIVRYDIAAGTFAALGTGASAGNQIVYGLAVAANGDVYAVGDFFDMGGVANADYVARWDGSSWNALGAGLNAAGRTVTIHASTGNVWIGGDFTTAGGTTVNRVTYWDGSAFNTVGSGPGLDNTVRAIIAPAPGTIVIGGDFRAENGGTPGDNERLIRFAWNPPSSVFVDISGFNGSVYAIRRLASGSYLFGGSFTEDELGNSMDRIASASGITTTRSEVGGGADGIVRTIYEAADGNIWVGGDFATVGSLSVNGLARRSGDTWVSPTLDLGSNTSVRIITEDSGDIYVGHDVSGSVSGFAGSTDITYEGTAPAYPVITIKRDGGTSVTLLAITNKTTGAELAFDAYTLQNGETITIDTRPGSRGITNNQGSNLLSQLLPTSHFGSFYLVPENGTGSRTNTFEFLALNEGGSATVTATIRYRVAYISAD